jgi:hypothetical protein
MIFSVTWKSLGNLVIRETLIAQQSFAMKLPQRGVLP